MATLPPNYPAGCSDDELVRLVSELNLEILKTGANINDVMRIQPLVAIGQAELQLRMSRRTSENLVTLQSAITTFQTSSDRTSKWLIVLTATLILLTVALLGTSLALLAR
jgi:hypothetical protein